MAKSLDYWAGLFDGEGCIGIYHNKSNGSYQLRIQVEMTHEGIIFALKEAFGGRVYTKEAKAPRKQRWIWLGLNSIGADALCLLKDHLVVKSDQCIEALSCDWYSFKGRPLTDEERNKRIIASQNLAKLNQRGFYE